MRWYLPFHVTTDVGSFTAWAHRRRYPFVVIVGGLRPHVLEARHAGILPELVPDDAGPAWRVLGWAGRLDLARTLATSRKATPYAAVRIYSDAGALLEVLR